jgi:Kef-type K+ transport system membrane component KefB
MLTEKLADYFSLGFDTPSSSDIPLKLGKKRRGSRTNLLQELACWLLLTCGIFLRKALMLVDLNWVDASLTPRAFLASAVIALAVFPPFMRWFNRSRPRPTLESLATAFAFGFFLNLAALAAHKILPQWSI